MAKVLNKSAKKLLSDDMSDIKIMRIYSISNILFKFNWVLNNMNDKAAIDLKL